MLSFVEAPPRQARRTMVLRLRSTPSVYVVGLLHWARDGYAVARATGGPVAEFIQVFADGYRLGAVLAEGLLRDEIPVTFETADVVLRLTDEEHRAFQVRQASLPDVPKDLVEATPLISVLPDFL